MIFVRALMRPGLLGLVVAISAALSPASAHAAAAPAWSITQQAMPTSFAAGETASGSTASGAFPIYFEAFTNVGGAEATETITIEDTVGTGLTPAAAVVPEVRNVKAESAFHSCAVSGQKVTCTVSTKVIPGDVVVVALPVDVSAGAPSSVSNEVTIEGGGAQAVSQSVTTPIGEHSSFEFPPGAAGLAGVAVDEDGTPATGAGSHPYSLALEAGLSTERISGVPNFSAVRPTEELKNITFRLPEGMIVNPTAASQCTEANLIASSAPSGERCPLDSQIGQLSFSSSRIGGAAMLDVGLYNLKPPPGVAAEFGFNALGATVVIQGGLDGDFHLKGGGRDLLAKLFVTHLQATLWGSPSDSGHDQIRTGSGLGSVCEENGFPRPETGCPATPRDRPFLTMPTSCGPPQELTAGMSSWEAPTVEVTASTRITDSSGTPLDIAGCNALEFSPSITSQATTNQGDSPSGLDFDLRQPQNESLENLSVANLKTTKVSLPEGMALNPSAAAGRATCSEQQMGYAPSGGKIRFATTAQNCPDAAKVGTLEATTPLLENKLPGAVYLAKPFDNPFGSLLGIYLAIEDETTGVVVKLAGKVEPDPKTGQLTTTFEESPDLPLEDISLHFFNGARGVLTTPLTCGAHTTNATLTPWSTPEGADANLSDSIQTAASCAATEAAAPNAPRFTAGTVSPLAGAFSPFVLRLARADGTQHITGIDTTLPEGLVGRLTGIPYCPDAQIAAAEARRNPNEGVLEQQSPSCPSASEVGTVVVGAGSGPTPVYVTGHAYLAGPYKGAPLSLAIVTPAVAGPFDLGTVVVRVALNVGLESAQIHAVSDPLPTIRQGIPLDVRSVEVKLDRSSFTLNPTSCEPMAIEGTASTQTGQTATLENRFQVGECSRLGFKPKLKLRLEGATRRSGHPALKAIVTMPSGGANIASAQVGLPHSEFLDQGNLDKVCVQADLKAGTCPAGSIYGHARAWTPLLEKPLEGPVYLGVGYGHQLPDLVADLNGQIRVLVHGRVDTTKRHGIRNTFEVVPDAPVSRFVLEMKGGKKYGLLENSQNVCRKVQRASAMFTAQNGKIAHLRPEISNGCKSRSMNKKTTR